MSIISARTGLGRSSIYHHFANGKQEMAHRSLDAVEAFIGAVGEIARDGSSSPLRRWQAIEAMLRQHYQGGLLGCLLGVFALEDVPDVWLFPADSKSGHLEEHKEDRSDLSKWGNDQRQSYRTLATIAGISEVNAKLLMNRAIPV